MVKYILASQSPRRKELLEKLGYKFEVIASQAEEPKFSDITEIEDLALFKAKDVLEQVKYRKEEISRDG